MTDKEKFRKKVEKLKSNLIHGACSSQVAMETRCKEEAYNEVLAILDSTQEVPISKEWIEELRTKLDSMSKEDFKKVFDKYAIDFKGEPVSEELIDVAKQYVKEHVIGIDKVTFSIATDMFVSGAKWKKAHNWKPADGDDLPEIDREVIALLVSGKVVFAHRPPEYWDGKDIVTGKVTRNYPKTYDKGGWNIPNVKYWLDCSMPKEIKL
jgi:hypothetical protein